MTDETKSLIGFDAQGNRHWLGDYDGQDAILSAVHAWLQGQYGQCNIDAIEDNGGQFKHPDSPHGYMTMDAFTTTSKARLESMGDKRVIGSSELWPGVK